MINQPQRFGAVFGERTRQQTDASIGTVDSFDENGIVLEGETLPLPHLSTYAPTVGDVVLVQRFGAGAAVVTGSVLLGVPQPEELTITAATWELYDTGSFDQPCKVFRQGNFAHLWGVIKATTNPGGGETLFTLAAKYRPIDRLLQYMPLGSGQLGVEVQTDGDVRIYNPGGSVASFGLNLTWVV